MPEEQEQSWEIDCQKAMSRHDRVHPIQVSVFEIIKAPPCLNCLFWHPVVEPDRYASWTKKREVALKICHSPEMYPDFSCYRNRKLAPKTVLEKSTKTPIT